MDQSKITFSGEKASPPIRTKNSWLSSNAKDNDTQLKYFIEYKAESSEHINNLYKFWGVGEIEAYEDMLKCMKSLTRAEDYAIVSQECWDCLVYCSLFPKDYEVDGDTLIQLLMAEDLIMEENPEEIAAAYLRALCKYGEVVSLLKEDYGTGKMWYKMIGFEIPKQVLERSKINPVRVISDTPSSVLIDPIAETKHLHVTLQCLLTKDLQALGKFTKMRTLLLLQDHRANVDCIPCGFFMSLHNLRVLDLSRTKISELPSSIGNATSLRFLDLSETLVTRLPETIECLQNLQTLKLQNCPRLLALPKATRKLTSLRHLDLGTLRRIHSMPAGIGALTYLRTLSEFIVGREIGCCIRELKNMNDLGGKLCLSKLENVAGLDDAEEANLISKQRLKKLELRWTDDEYQEHIGVNHEVISYLQPHTSLQDLRIVCYGGSTFPSWISHLSFVNLRNITIFKCSNCQILPSLGQLPSLESLSLIELIGIRFIDIHFRRNKFNPSAVYEDDQFVAFPALQKLEMKSMINLEIWSNIGRFDLPCLQKLSIKNCTKLAALCELTNMISLEYLELNQCTKLPSLPNQLELMPTSLKTLVIEDCPLLSISCSMEAQDWVESQHSPNLFIYQREEGAEAGAEEQGRRKAGLVLANSKSDSQIACSDSEAQGFLSSEEDSM
ncbi:disease resistance protein RGA2-like [Beta vulgaris subsp. vulgaris]|uniref:disease resistance protein RGA2-like n=1 Tax=Beta vulgaris subsp. vulgaris TaxID=3555 RepID=UPI002549687C|nr:disease resistance protein RGA2-like [Beta vulgaris subsp. vulgaris]